MLDTLFKYLNPVTAIAAACGFLSLGNWLYCARIRRKTSTKSKQFKQALDVAALIKSVAFTFLKPATLTFIGILALFIGIFSLLEHSINPDSAYIFTLTMILGVLAMIGVSFVCANCCLTGNIDILLAASEENGLRKAHIAGIRSSKTAGLFIAFVILSFHSLTWFYVANGHPQDAVTATEGFALGSIFFAFLQRSCGGVFTKAADIAADTAGKLFRDIPEDSKENPATIADNAGDAIGDGAGAGVGVTAMYFVLFRIAAQIVRLDYNFIGIAVFSVVLAVLSLLIPMRGVSRLNSEGVFKSNCLIAEKTLKQPVENFLLLTITCAIFLFFVMIFSNNLGDFAKENFPTICKALVLVSIVIYSIIFATNAFTSISSFPVRSTIEKTLLMGSSMNTLYAYIYSILSVVCLFTVVILPQIVIYWHGEKFFNLASVIQLLFMGAASVGIMAVDIYGPTTDIAGGLASMTDDLSARENTDVLDTAGNTTKSLTKGFTNGLTAVCAFFAIKNLSINFSFTETMSLIFGLIFAFIINSVSIWATTYGADRAFKVTKAKMEEYMTNRELGDSYYTSVARKITLCACSVTPWLLIILAICIVLPSEAHNLGLVLTALPKAIAECNDGAIRDNVKKGLERQKGDIKKYKKELAAFEREVREFDMNFNIEDLGDNYYSYYGKMPNKGKKILESRLLHMANLYTTYVSYKKAVEAAIAGDCAGDPLKDVSGPVMNVTALAGILFMTLGSRVLDTGCFG